MTPLFFRVFLANFSSPIFLVTRSDTSMLLWHLKDSDLDNKCSIQLLLSSNGSKNIFENLLQGAWHLVHLGYLRVAHHMVAVLRLVSFSVSCFFYFFKSLYIINFDTFNMKLTIYSSLKANYYKISHRYESRGNPESSSKSSKSYDADLIGSS